MEYRDEDLSKDEQEILLKIQKEWTEIKMIPISVTNLYDLFIQDINIIDKRFYTIKAHNRVDKDFEKIIGNEIERWTITRGVSFFTVMRMLMEYNFFEVSFQEYFDAFLGND